MDLVDFENAEIDALSGCMYNESLFNSSLEYRERWAKTLLQAYREVSGMTCDFDETMKRIDEVLGRPVSIKPVIVNADAPF